MPHFAVRTDKTLSNIEIQETDVYKIFSQIKETKSQGPDNLHPKYIKETAQELTKAAVHIFRKSIEEGKLPQDWKIANITPIHKKGAKHNVSNYRPISLTSIMCKSLEKIIRDQIMSYMESNNLFTEHQHGFRSGHSCVTQLIEVIDNWTEELDKHNSVDTIYLDFQKAFDKVPHRRLLHKLKSYGICGSLYNWLEDFLNNRKQRVVLNDTHSDWGDVTSGIPQGSVLGPILFLIYINDLPDVVHNIAKLFADDTKLYSVVNNSNQQFTLQEDINKLTDWSNEWLLKFNIDKCKHLHLGRQTNYTYTMAGKEITKINNEKDLGIIIDNELKFQTHICTQVKKANQILGLIKRSFSYLDEEMFLTLYKSLVRPHLEYGSNIWSVIYKKEAISIENVQRRATKLLTNLKDLSYCDRLKHLGLPTLEYRRLRSDMVETYKIMNNLDHVNKEKIFPLNTNITRGHNKRIYKKYSRTNVRKFSFTQRVVETWNSLPANVVEAKSVNIFKNKLNAHWKGFYQKFVPSCYGPEATRNSVRKQNGSEEA
ncbi:hypothetical protein FSP39_003928 [Pinctada imbricata]|uniref:Reverse transcriptase domain-containing protein n=1 Tax=Pinctada imbricata TaxID=66713 RepID=A0AA88YAX1_PINIB|nr:hypothetical protein FSP39_003928 [Pinctada imbricata]